MKNLILSLAFLFLCVSLFAAETANTIKQSAPTITSGKTHGVVDIRPSYTSQSGEMHTENAAELGYDFSPGVSAFYRQEFNTNLYNPNNVNGINSTMGDGHIKGTNYNLIPIEGTPITLGYEARLYLPTMERKRDAGMLTVFRNYVWLKYQATNSLNVYLAEVPVVHLYNKTGSNNAANPIFENKVELVGEYIFTNKMKLVVPLKLSTTKYSSYSANALNNDAWVNHLYLHPELHYRLTDNLKVGGAFYTGALTNASFNGLTVEEGFKSSVFQAFFVATL